MADGVTQSSPAAAPTEPVRTTASKARSAFKGGSPPGVIEDRSRIARENINCLSPLASAVVSAMSKVDRFDPFEGRLGFALASRVGSLVFASGMTGLDVVTDTVPSGLADQMRQAYRNIGQILGHFGGSLANVIEQTIFFVGEAEPARAAYDVVSRETFGNAAPAATMVGVTMLVEPRYHVEIKVVAAIGDAS